jgi:starch synthase
VRLDTSEQLLRQALGGADLILLPSQSEPCGWRHIAALRYGAAPLVRETGGMADTIVDVTPANLAVGTANGFVFRDFTATALEDALHRAMNVYLHQSDMWSRVITCGIHQDWSWAKTARAYARLYEQVAAPQTPEEVASG